MQGVVIELDQHTATVCVHQPIGRFKSGEIRRCPPLLLDRLHPAAGGPRPGESPPLSTTRQADRDLDNLIDEITIDSNDEDEQLMGFEATF